MNARTDPFILLLCSHSGGFPYHSHLHGEHAPGSAFPYCQATWDYCIPVLFAAEGGLREKNSCFLILRVSLLLVLPNPQKKLHFLVGQISLPRNKQAMSAITDKLSTKNIRFFIGIGALLFFFSMFFSQGGLNHVNLFVNVVMPIYEVFPEGTGLLAVNTIVLLFCLFAPLAGYHIIAATGGGNDQLCSLITRARGGDPESAKDNLVSLRLGCLGFASFLPFLVNMISGYSSYLLAVNVLDFQGNLFDFVREFSYHAPVELAAFLAAAGASVALLGSNKDKEVRPTRRFFAWGAIAVAMIVFAGIVENRAVSEKEDHTIVRIDSTGMTVTSLE